ncbi:MAG: FHA domain-containing protein, partial [Mycobacterium sp.]|nr:FHA domain-containing protein [Mycobacterium sp.]
MRTEAFASPLTVWVGPRHYTFPAGRDVTVGRDSRSDLRLESADPSTSPTHLVLHHDGRQWVAIDRSQRGIYVDGVRMSTVFIRDGRAITLGDPRHGLRLVFQLGGPATAPPGQRNVPPPGVRPGPPPPPADRPSELRGQPKPPPRQPPPWQSQPNRPPQPPAGPAMPPQPKPPRFDSPPRSSRPSQMPTRPFRSPQLPPEPSQPPGQPAQPQPARPRSAAPAPPSQLPTERFPSPQPPREPPQPPPGPAQPPSAPPEPPQPQLEPPKAAPARLAAAQRKGHELVGRMTGAMT